MPGNKTLIFKKVPDSLPVPGVHLVIEDRDFDHGAPAPAGGITIEILTASFDPYLRGKMRAANLNSYSPAFNLDDPITNAVVGRVIKSDNSEYQPGDIVYAAAPIAQYATIPEPAKSLVRKIPGTAGLDLGLFLGPLGFPGLTAFAGLYKIGKPKRGETLFVSSAAGAVGQVVGQIGKHEGLRVIGSVGSDEKLDFIEKELGFDGGFNYKKERPADALKRLAPQGVDIYFENVGGEHLEAVIDAMNTYGRIALCGMISQYNTPREERYGIRNTYQMVGKGIEMVGFLVGQPGFADAYSKDHQEKMQKWLAEGSFKPKLHVTEGIDNAAEGFVGLLRGDNFGKAVLKIKSP